MFMKTFLTLTASVMYTLVFGQQDLSGLWQGKLNAGVELTLVFDFSKSGDHYACQVSCPEQGLKNLEASTVVYRGDSVLVDLKAIGGQYEAVRQDSLMNGTWVQGPARIPLQLKKVSAIVIAEKQQTPKPPFPYTTEDITYFNASHSIRYGATISIPEGNGPFPAVLLITGSGQQNRDEAILGHKPFAVIADYLVRRGFVVLRVDDRGTGETTGDVMGATSRDFANDALVSLAYLQHRKEVNKNKIGLLGHSEGGMIAQMIAAERKDIRYIVMLAGPGEKIPALMLHQNEAVFLAAGMPKTNVDAYLKLYKDLLSTASKGTAEEARSGTMKRLSQWIAETPAAVVASTTGIVDEASKKTFVDIFVEQVHSAWYRYFLQYDPAPTLQKIKADVLALNGDRDIQVVAKTNLPAIEAALKKSGSKHFEVKAISGLNHLFQHCRSCTIQEYGQLEETIAPEVLKMIGDWLTKSAAK